MCLLSEVRAPAGGSQRVRQQGAMDVAWHCAATHQHQHLHGWRLPCAGFLRHDRLSRFLPPGLQVAYEHDEDFIPHMAPLLHMALLCLDADEALVAATAQQLLINMVYSMSAAWVEREQAEDAAADCSQVRDAGARWSTLSNEASGMLQGSGGAATQPRSCS